jgi:hypothetical protein
MGAETKESPPFGAIIKKVWSHLWLPGLGSVIAALIFDRGLWLAGVAVTFGGTLIVSLEIKLNFYRKKSFAGKIAAELNRPTGSKLDSETS